MLSLHTEKEDDLGLDRQAKSNLRKPHIVAEVVTLHVFITHWIKENNARTFSRRLFDEVIRLASERRRVVGIPQLSHPIYAQLFALGGVSVDQLRIKIFSNRSLVINPNDVVVAAGRSKRNTSVEVIVVDTSEMKDQFELTWVHKSHLRTAATQSNRNDLFLYLEHDQLFTQRNFDYFRSNAASLSEFGIRPSFMRIELSQTDPAWRFTDARRPFSISNSGRIAIGGNNWIENPVPYSGMYMMTRDDTLSHLSSDSFSLPKSKERFPSFGTSERAALGNSYEGLQNAANLLRFPVGSTNFVQVDEGMQIITNDSYVWHLSNRYATNHLGQQLRGFGSVPVTFESTLTPPNLPSQC